MERLREKEDTVCKTIASGVWFCLLLPEISLYISNPLALSMDDEN